MSKSTERTHEVVKEYKKKFDKRQIERKKEQHDNFKMFISDKVHL